MPAYENLANGLTALKGTGLYEGGLCSYPEGKEYYEYLVTLNTGTSYKDIPSLKQAVHSRMAKDLTEAARYLNEDPALAHQAADYRFSLTDPEAILADLEA